MTAFVAVFAAFSALSIASFALPAKLLIFDNEFDWYRQMCDKK
jgi:hypothetical protein